MRSIIQVMAIIEIFFNILLRFLTTVIAHGDTFQYSILVALWTIVLVLSLRSAPPGGK